MERVPGRSPRAAPLAVNVGDLVVAVGPSADIRLSPSEARLQSGRPRRFTFGGWALRSSIEAPKIEPVAALKWSSIHTIV